MPGIGKKIRDYKSKRRVKKMLKGGKDPEVNKADGTPNYKHGGIIQHD